LQKCQKKKKYIKLKKFKKCNYDTNLVLNTDLYINTLLKNVPPELWALSIIYDYYYSSVIFYIMHEDDPVLWRIPKVPQGRHTKWKISSVLGSISIYGTNYTNYWKYLFSGGTLDKVFSNRPRNIGWQFFFKLGRKIF